MKIKFILREIENINLEIGKTLEKLNEYKKKIILEKLKQLKILEKNLLIYRDASISYSVTVIIQDIPASVIF